MNEKDVEEFKAVGGRMKKIYLCLQGCCEGKEDVKNERPTKS